MSKKDTSISVIGLGKLGLPIALVLAQKYRVIGMDNNEQRVRDLNNRAIETEEHSVKGMLMDTNLELSATTSLEHALEDTDITFIIVPTPSIADNTFSLNYISQVIRGMKVLKKKKDHLVIVNSTVLPGDMDNTIAPMLELATGHEIGKSIGLCYNPEFVALGSVIHDFTHPDVVLIGESDTESGNRLARVHQNIIETLVPIVKMNFRNAELSKIGLNSYITMKISFANMLAGICERMPGGDVDKVTKALGYDSRIGSKYLKGGTAFGGPCFVRDTKAFTAMSEKLGCNSCLVAATESMNNAQVPRILNIVAKRLEGRLSDNKVAVLGMTYKPDTDVIEESAGMLIAWELAKFGAAVYVHDPKGLKNMKEELGPVVQYCDTLEDCLAGADIAIIATPWEQYKNLEAKDFESMRQKVVLDCWRILDADYCGVEVIGLGRNND